MAVLQMDRIEVCAMKRERKRVLELLQRRGTVEAKDMAVDSEVFSKQETASAQAVFTRNADTAAQAAGIVERYAEIEKPAMAFLQGRTVLSPEQNAAFEERREHVLRTAQQVVQWERELAEQHAEILRGEAQQEALRPWLDLPVAQNFSGTRKTAVFIGSVAGEHTLDSLLEMLASAGEGLDSLHVEVVSKSPEQTNFYAMVPKKDTAKAEEALRSIGFTRPAAAGVRPPRELEQQLQQQCADAQARIETCTADIRKAKDSFQDFQLLEDNMRMRAEKYATLERLAQSSHVFVLEGYVPHRAAEALQQELVDRFGCAVELTPAEDPGEEVPVLLENNWFARPTESVLESYALPGKGELDPTAVMSVFYYIMFGLMFSDAGYGLILAVATGLLLLKFKNMENGMKMFMQMFFWCGVSTIFWGIVFSSYFGDTVDIIAVNFLGRSADLPTLMPPLWFSPLEKPMWLLMFCMAIGIVHLTVGYIMCGITNFKNGDYSAIVYDAVFPIAFIYPLVVVLVSTEIFESMLGFHVYTLPGAVMLVCMVVAGVSGLGVVLFAGRESRNWGKRLLKGLYALYNMGAGWLSDILSYSRLLALGLATGVIASVMNQLGTLAGGGIGGLILFIVVFAVGQSLNFGINILGAYVHSNRLEYVEFFGKFYQGGGRMFSPLGIHTKHYKIEEETQNG